VRQIRLASNESALGTSPRVVEALQRAAASSFRYPDGGSAELRQVLGQHYDLDPANLVIGNGSDELLHLIAHAYAGEGDEVLYTAHGFLVYPIAALAAGARPVAVPERNLTADVDAILAAVTPRTKVVFLANPNNPTGSYLSAAEIARLQAGLPSQVLLVIDAAYAEFVGAPDYTAGHELVRRHDNVVVTHTFSKIYALGGLRLGWVDAPPAVVAVLHRVRGPFNVNLLAQVAGVAALEDREFIARSRQHNDIWRAWLADALKGLGLTPHPSAGNFILVSFKGRPGQKNGDAAADAEAARLFLKQHGILVRQMGNYGLPDALRITIGLEDEMKAVVETLGRYLKS